MALRADYHHQLLLIHDSSMGEKLSRGTVVATRGGRSHPSLDAPRPARAPVCPRGSRGGLTAGSSDGKGLGTLLFPKGSSYGVREQQNTIQSKEENSPARVAQPLLLRGGVTL